MARKRNEPKWVTWAKDPNVQCAYSNGGLEVRVPGGKDGFRRSGWRRLIAYSEEATILRLLHELGWPTPQRANS